MEEKKKKSMACEIYQKETDYLPLTGPVHRKGTDRASLSNEMTARRPLTKKELRV